MMEVFLISEFNSTGYTPFCKAEVLLLDEFTHLSRVFNPSLTFRGTKFPRVPSLLPFTKRN